MSERTKLLAVQVKMCGRAVRSTVADPTHHGRQTWSYKQRAKLDTHQQLYITSRVTNKLNVLLQLDTPSLFQVEQEKGGWEYVDMFWCQSAIRLSNHKLKFG